MILTDEQLNQTKVGFLKTANEFIKSLESEDKEDWGDPYELLTDLVAFISAGVAHGIQRAPEGYLDT